MPAQKPAGNIDGKAAQSTLRSRCRRAAAAHRLRTRRDARGSTSDRRIIGTVLTGKQGGWGLDYFSFALRQIGCLRQLDDVLSRVLFRLTNRVSWAWLLPRFSPEAYAVRASGRIAQLWQDRDLRGPETKTETSQHFS